MRAIAEEVGIRGASIYAHFTSKDDLFLSVRDDLYQHMTWENIDIDAIKNNPQEVQVKTLLSGVFKSYYHYFAEHRTELLFWQLLRFFPPSHLASKLGTNQLLYERPVLEIYADLFQYAIDRGQIREGLIPTMVLTFFVMVSGYTDSILIVPFRLPEDQLDSGFELFWKGIT